MQRVQFGSPSKENQGAFPSPSKKKNTELISQILLFLKNSGVVLPTHLNKSLQQTQISDSPLKAQTNRDSLDDAKKLKVQLIDAQFQLKKVQEDFAQFKRSTKMQKEKQSKKYQEIISKLKQSIEQNTEDGNYNLYKIKKENANELQGLKQRHRLQLSQECNKIRSELTLKLENTQKIHSRQLLQTNKQWQNKYNEKLTQLQSVIKKNKNQYQDSIKLINLKHKNILDQKQKKHDSIRVALQSQRKTQQKLHEKTKMQASKEKQQLVSDLCFEKNVNQHLNEQISLKNMEIKRLKGMIRDLQVDLQLLDEKSKKTLQKCQQEYFEKINLIQDQKKEEILKLKHIHLEQIQTFQKRILNLQETHRQKQNCFIESLEQVSISFQKRPSKKEDLSEIDKLKWALTRREQEVRKLSKQLKNCNLELQNKEEIYTRMFRGNSMSRQKRNTKDKEERQQAIVEQKLGKQSLFRKSQTADIKFLLKIYNNTKNI